MANYLASIFGTEQDVSTFPVCWRRDDTNCDCRKSTVPSTTKLVPAGTAIDARESMSNHHTHKPFFYPTFTRTQPTTRKTR